MKQKLRILTDYWLISVHAAEYQIRSNLLQNEMYTMYTIAEAL